MLGDYMYDVCWVFICMMYAGWLYLFENQRYLNPHTVEWSRAGMMLMNDNILYQ